MDIPGGNVDNHSVDESPPSTFTATAVDGSSVDWSSDSEAQFQMDDLVLQQPEPEDLVPQPDLGSGGSIPEADHPGSIQSQSPLASSDISIIPAVKQVAGSFLNVLMSSYNFQGPTTNVQHISILSNGAIRHVYDYIVRAGPSLGIYPPPAAQTATATETETGGVAVVGNAEAETETETGGVAVEAETGGEETGIQDYSSPS